jgi:hypothetical protein
MLRRVEATIAQKGTGIKAIWNFFNWEKQEEANV